MNRKLSTLHIVPKSLLAICSCLLFPLSSPAPLTGYLKIGDIKGESQRAEHEEEIDIHDIQWKIESADSAIGGADKVSMKEFSIIKEIDKSTPKLMEALVTGQTIPLMRLALEEAPLKDSGEAHLDYLIITMENVSITSLAVTYKDDRDRPVERVSLNFSKVNFQYTPEDPATGRPQEPVSFNWDLADATGG